MWKWWWWWWQIQRQWQSTDKKIEMVVAAETLASMLVNTKAAVAALTVMAVETLALVAVSATMDNGWQPSAQHDGLSVLSDQR